MTTTTNTSSHPAIAEWQCPECDYSAKLLDIGAGFFRCVNSQRAYWGFSHTTSAIATARFNRVFVDTHNHYKKGQAQPRWQPPTRYTHLCDCGWEAVIEAEADGSGWIVADDDTACNYESYDHSDASDEYARRIAEHGCLQTNPPTNQPTTTNTKG